MSRYLEELVSEKSKLRDENEKLRGLSKKAKFEKGDERALIIAAFTTILPVVIIGVLLFYGVISLIFIR